MSDTVTEPEVTNNTAVTRGDIRHIPLARIGVGERKRVLDHAGLDQLKADIRLNGLLHPIGVKLIDTGDGNEAFRIVFGLRRFTAHCALDAEGALKDSTILASVYPTSVPDWLCELAEIAENLCRRELSSEERDAHTTLYAALVKQHFDVIDANSRHGSATRRDDACISSNNGDATKPTAREKIAQDLGIDKTTVDKRVKRAARSVGRTASVEKTDAPTLTEIGKAAIERASTVNKVAPDIKVTKTLLKLEKGGVLPGDIQAGIEGWWRETHPEGEVVFHETRG